MLGWTLWDPIETTRWKHIVLQERVSNSHCFCRGEAHKLETRLACTERGSVAPRTLEKARVHNH
jgi:hypothetical protein